MVELKFTSVSSNVTKDETNECWPTDGNAFMSGDIKKAPYEVSPHIQALDKPTIQATTKIGFIGKLLNFFKK